MALEELLSPVKWVDEQVLRQYTKIGKKFHLDEGRRKYYVATVLVVTSTFLTGPAARSFGGYVFDNLSWFITTFFDLGYSVKGLAGRIKDETTSGDTKVLNPITHFYKKYNSIVRFPTFCAGIGFVAKSGVDLYHHLSEGTPLDPHSTDHLQYGLGLLAVASSMYIKEMDPKLLDRAPVWKTAGSWIKEKVQSLLPGTAPEPAATKSSSEEYAVHYLARDI